jgi:hypothetical protein
MTDSMQIARELAALRGKFERLKCSYFVANILALR